MDMGLAATLLTKPSCKCEISQDPSAFLLNMGENGIVLGAL
jgi:hypothetical protein